MPTELLNCKRIFESAYNKRYTWPKQFNGYKGNCIFIEDDTTYESMFSVDKTFKVNVSNVENQEKVKLISSQLFEVTIHRLKRDFEKIHSENNFKLIKEDTKGKQISVSGKNEGDKYRVKDNKINMVFRNIHGLIIEIFVEEFFDTGLGFLTKKYTSQQLDNKSLNPLSPKYSYLDEFTNIERGLWLLKSRSIEYLNEQNKPVKKNFKFENLILLQ
tara:strand:- start:450 stop:1097 length:648 start_codon:yes stop_codon:yes gene_type:complete